MRNVLAVLVLVALVAPVYGATDYFRVAGDGSFDTYASTSAIEGYTNAGSGGSARLGYAKQGHGWLAWAANDSAGAAHTSVGDVGGQTLATFLTANPGSTAKLWVNLNTNSLVGSFALETVRCGNTGLIQEDGGSGTGFTYSAPAAGITNSTQPWAWKAADPSTYLVNGYVGPAAGLLSEPWLAAGTTSSHYAAPSPFTPGQQIMWGANSKLGYDGSMTVNGGEPWALNALIGMDWSQGGTDFARAVTAGQVVNNDGAGNAVLFSQSNFVGATAPRPSAVAGNWYAITLSSDLLASLASDSATKALLFNNWFANCVATSANPAFVTKDQGGGGGAAFLEITPEPATMILLALGGLALLRRRTA